MSAPRVLYAAHSVAADGGGMERQGRALVNRSRARMTVVASEGLDGLDERVASRRVALVKRPAMLRIVWFYLASRRAVRRLAGEQDVIHSCGAVLSQRVDVATVHLLHAAVGPDALGDRRGVRRLNARAARAAGKYLERRQFRPEKVGVLVAVSELVADQIARYYPDMPCRVIANGVDADEFAGQRVPREGPLRVTMVTGDFALKGVDLVLEALALAPNVSLRVVGRGDVVRYDEMANRLGVRDRVQFDGPQPSSAEALRQSDVVVCVSHYEAFGISMVEGALSGCAVVATNVGVAASLIGDNLGGVIVERSAGALADALEHLASDQETLERMAHHANQAAKGFTLEAMVSAYDELYDEIVSQR